MPPDLDASRALIVIAHGSRSEEANDEFRRVLGKLDKQSIGYQHIEAAFLEAAKPSLSAVVDCLSRCAVRSVDVYPLFFNCGRHVNKDIPALIDSINEQFPDIQLTLLPYFGSFEGLASVMTEHIARSQNDAS